MSTNCLRKCLAGRRRGAPRLGRGERSRRTTCLALEPLENRCLLSGVPHGLADLSPGAGSSTPANFVAAGGLVFFTADDGIHGRELWRTDGTAEGTVVVKDIRQGDLSSNPESLTNVGGTLFFLASDEQHLGRGLWMSDGTPNGTTQVRWASSGESPVYGAANLTAVAQLCTSPKGVGSSTGLGSTDSTPG